MRPGQQLDDLIEDFESSQTDIKDLQTDALDLDKRITELEDTFGLQCDLNDQTIDVFGQHCALIKALANGQLALLEMLKNRDNPHWAVTNWANLQSLEATLKDIALWQHKKAS